MSPPGHTGPMSTAAQPRHDDLARRSRLRELLALTPEELAAPAALRGVPAAEAARGEEAVDLVQLVTAEGTQIPCHLVRPARPSGAAVVLVAGHGVGIDGLVDAGDGYHHGLALDMAAAGVTVLCPEMISFGRRRFPRPQGAEPYEEAESSCGIDAARFLLDGRPVMGRRIADASAAVRALGALEGIDPARVAVAGGSGGGAVALMLAAADERVAAALVATYFSSFAASIASIRHCPCNIVPGLLAEGLEMADIARLIAPRPLVIEAGEQDPIFPIEATRRAVASLPEAWERHGAAPAELVVTPGVHRFVGEESVELLVRALG